MFLDMVLYVCASGDMNSIYFDSVVVRFVGLDRLIVYGMWMVFVSIVWVVDLVVGGDMNCLIVVDVQFVDIVYFGD